MARFARLAGWLFLLGLVALPSAALAQVSGEYLEMRTCDVFTGPCFANSEIGLTGKQALMAWHIEQGSHKGVDLSGLRVVVAISASDTLAYGSGLVSNPDPIKSVILADAKATCEQREALVDFAKAHTSKFAHEVQRVDFVPIEMNLDHVQMVADLKAGDEAVIRSRKLNKTDCVCSNEEIYHLPLANVDNYAPAYTLEGKFAGKGLGVSWSHPFSRSIFLATFDY
jgi:hypothetical protein